MDTGSTTRWPVACAVTAAATYQARCQHGPRRVHTWCMHFWGGCRHRRRHRAGRRGASPQDVELVAGLGGGQVLLHRLAGGGVGGVGVQHVDALREPSGEEKEGDNKAARSGGVRL